MTFPLRTGFQKPDPCSFGLLQFPDAHCKIREILMELTEVHGGGCVGGDRAAVGEPRVSRDVIGLDERVKSRFRTRRKMSRFEF